MNRGKNQAVYKFLPEMWISDKDEYNETVTAKITNWNVAPMKDIYESFINGEIKRQIKLFAERGGDVSSFDLEKASPIRVMEAVCNEGIPDIIGEISPLVFYCSSCNDVFQLNSPQEVNKSTWKCRKCGKSVKQLQMVYACECGYAEPVALPHIKGNAQLKYRPNENSFKMFYRDPLTHAEKVAELQRKCPNCDNRIIRVDNASSGRNYKAFTLNIINLIDHKSGEFYDKGLEAYKTIIAKWFGKLSEKDYDYILNNVELAFSDKFRSDSKRVEAETQVRSLIAMGLVTPEKFDEAVAGIMGSITDNKSVESYVIACDKIFSTKKAVDEKTYNEWLNYYSFKMMQYYTLKNAKRVITLEDSIERQLEMDFIESADEITELNERLGISAMQVSCDIQMVNCTYGYSRRTADPKKNMNRSCRLKLNAYKKTSDRTANMVYGSKLDTEGMLFEISQKKIIEWLYVNEIIEKEVLPDLDDDISVKKWYAEYIHGELISNYGEIIPTVEVPDVTITKYVFGLLHSISHAFISSACELSGLGLTSLTELINIETSSIFLYASNSQAIPLGALSGMAESNYAQFLKRVLEESKNCVFDPICMERDHTACSACLIIPEVACKHFNIELGRKYLYSFPREDIKTGFWEM